MPVSRRAHSRPGITRPLRHRLRPIAHALPAWGLALAAPFAHSQATPDAGGAAPPVSQVMAPVIITGSRVETSAFDVPYSVEGVDVGSVTNESLRVNASEVLSGVPGVVVLNRQNYAQDLQLSIRGHGARSTFGVRGIQVYMDGIPATMPDGQGQANHIDLSSLERLEVLRGPYSTLYGNASGGVIQAYTERGEGAPQLHSSFAMGSNGQKRLGLKATERAAA